MIFAHEGRCLQSHFQGVTKPRADNRIRPMRLDEQVNGQIGIMLVLSKIDVREILPKSVIKHPSYVSFYPITFIDILQHEEMAT